MLNWIVWNRTICIKMDLALNNLQRLICHKTQPINPTLQGPILELVYPWYTNTEYNRRKDNMNSYIHTRTFNIGISTICIQMVLKRKNIQMCPY